MAKRAKWDRYEPYSVFIERERRLKEDTAGNRKVETMSKFTPGSWKVAEDDPLKVVSTQPNGGIIAEASCWWYDKLETAPANARLIAAAPELLEGAKMLDISLQWEERRSGTTYNGMDTLRAAIAKAEGRDDK